MNRIDTQAQAGIISSLGAKRAEPVSPIEPVRPVAGEATMASGLSLSASRDAAGAQAPVDHERVSGIRKALEEGRYPASPSMIADAMIAAGYLSRTSR